MDSDGSIDGGEEWTHPPPPHTTKRGNMLTALRRVAFNEPVVSSTNEDALSEKQITQGWHTVLNVDDPNPYAVTVTGLTHKIIEKSVGVTIAEGSLKEAFTIPPKESTNATVSVAFTFNGLGAAGKSMLRSGKVTY
jgi:LEA14-like dessication related protein